MGYVIWGAGYRGKIIFEYLKDEVVAFLDSNPELIGKTYEDIPILSFTEAMSLFDNNVLIVSPFLDEEIIEKLKENNIYGYLRSNDCPKEFYHIHAEEILDKIIKKTNRKSPKYVVGVTLMGITLARRLKNNKLNVSLIDDVGLDYSLIEKISSIEDIMISRYNEREIPSNSDVVVVSGANNETLIEKTFSQEWIDAFWLDDLLPSEFQNKSIIDIKDSLQGKRCFIVATGPSLKIQDLDQLYKRKEICVSMNKIFYAFDETEWRPIVYFAEDWKMIKYYSKDIKRLNALKILSDGYDYEIDENENCYIVHYQVSLPDFRPGGFRDFTWGYSSGYSVIIGCIYLALYMGVKEIYLMGVDFNYSTDLTNPKNHFYGEKDALGTINKDVHNTFYYDSVLNNFIYTKMLAEKKYGAKIYNATRGGKLEVFPRVDFDKIMED